MTDYRILVDEDVHGASAAVLRDRDHDAVSVAETLGKGTADADVGDHMLAKTTTPFSHTTATIWNRG